MGVCLPRLPCHNILGCDLLKPVLPVDGVQVEFSLLRVPLDIRVQAGCEEVIEALVVCSPHLVVHTHLQLVQGDEALSELQEEVLVCLGEDVFKLVHRGLREVRHFFTKERHDLVQFLRISHLVRIVRISELLLLLNAVLRPLPLH